MTGNTHIAAGAVTGLFISSYLHLPILETVIVTSISAFTSLIPDIDNATSKLGRKNKLASFLIQLFIGHRTFFHAPLLYLGLVFMIARIDPSGLLALAFGLGTGTHLFLDLMNPLGIPLLWPFSKRYHIANFRSGGAADFVLGIALWILAATLVYLRIFS